jgi:cell division GTPase FtsZ
MHILLLSAGGGGGNILRSVKAAFRRDLTVTQRGDARYAERLRRALTTRFLDTNEFALSDLPKEERVLIGARTTGRLGARHDPAVALEALHESRSDIEALFSRYSIIILIGTGGKGTGSGTMFPLAQMARQQKKLVIPIFVRPSFERHEVDKRHYDYAVKAIEQFDAAGIRLIEILNDRGYAEHDPQPQPIVWERMNLPIARGLRGLIYVLWDLSQVDPSDLSILFAGHGRLRVGFAEIDPPERSDPDPRMVEQAADRCGDNPYYAFHKAAGTSLICIQGDWSNLVDAQLKGRLAAAMGAHATSPYSPLYVRAVGTPRPWGVTALFSEYTGTHRPLEIDWSLEKGIRTVSSPPITAEPVAVDPLPFEPLAAESEALDAVSEFAAEPVVAARVPQPERKLARRGTAGNSARRDTSVNEPPVSRAFATFWEFAIAVNRSDPAALVLAGDGAASNIPIDAGELRRLMGMMWFRTVVLGRLSAQWRQRVLDVLIDSAPVPDHAVKLGRQTMHLRELNFEQLQEVGAKTMVPDWIQADLDLLITVGRFWGSDAVKRFHFVDPPERDEPSMMASLLDKLRG